MILDIHAILHTVYPSILLHSFVVSIARGRDHSRGVHGLIRVCSYMSILGSKVAEGVSLTWFYGAFGSRLRRVRQWSRGARYGI
jgi:hypothetical protein